MPVQEMLRRMSSREITEWRAYFLLKAEEEQNKGKPPKLKSVQDFRAAFGPKVTKG